MWHYVISCRLYVPYDYCANLERIWAELEWILAGYQILHQPSRGNKTTLVRFSSKVTCAEGSPFCLTLHIWKPAKLNDSQSYNTVLDFVVPHYDRRE